MVDAKIITTGIFLVLVLGGAVTYQLLPEDLDRAYICNLNNVTGLFDKLSSTNVTGYYNLNGTNKQLTCKTKWVKLTDWCNLNKVDCNDFVNNGFPTDEKALPVEVYDETGAFLVKTPTLVINKDIVLNVNGTKVNITYSPVVKCICDKITGCKIQECLQ